WRRQMGKQMQRPVVSGNRIPEGLRTAGKRLRAKQTPEEAILWERLRNRQIGGLKFRRQQIIAGFIVDFYCHSARLVVEIDGPYHESKHDQERDAALNGQGMRVLRFSNEAVTTNMENVIRRIELIADAGASG
ncbi:MAG TPA: endonuclease domain-containing protein, partial [Chthonomonadales bacterium]|nr:endonuclease domain-containing protein [Chthonomonadales bacterium]